MVGRDIGDVFSTLSRNTKFGDVLLEAKGMGSSKIHNISFQLRAGEVIGFAGLVGAGRTETVRALFGADKLTEGEIYLEGKKVIFKSPADAIREGIAFCPEDRKAQGLILHSTVPVSYTHLDVYKRQIQAYRRRPEARRTESSPRGWRSVQLLDFF